MSVERPSNRSCNRRIREPENCRGLPCWQGSQAEAAIKRYGDKDIHWSMQGMLRLMPAAMMRLFQPTLDNIKNAISQVLDSPDVTG